MIKAIIFDFFGVICPDLHWTWLNKNIKDLKDREDFFVELSHKVDRGVISEKDFINEAARIAGMPAEAVEVEILAMIKIDAKLLSFIKTLKNSYKTALLSSAHYTLLEKILEDNDLYPYFNEVIISSQVGLLKEDPQLYEVAIQKLGFDPNEIIYIDDAPKNVTMANSLGLKAIRYSDPASLASELMRYGCKL